MTTAPLTRNDITGMSLLAAGTLCLGALGKATLSAKTAALTSYFAYEVATDLSLQILTGVAEQCGRPITDREVTLLGATSLGLSAALYLSGASGVALTLAVANACLRRNNSWENAALSTGVYTGQVIGLSSYTNFIPSCISFFAKIELAYQVTQLAHQAIKAVAGEFDKENLRLSQLIFSVKLAVHCYFQSISIGTCVAGILGMNSYIKPAAR